MKSITFKIYLISGIILLIKLSQNRAECVDLPEKVYSAREVYSWELWKFCEVICNENYPQHKARLRICNRALTGVIICQYVLVTAAPYVSGPVNKIKAKDDNLRNLDNEHGEDVPPTSMLIPPRPPTTGEPDDPATANLDD